MGSLNGLTTTSASAARAARTATWSRRLRAIADFRRRAVEHRTDSLGEAVGHRRSEPSDFPHQAKNLGTLRRKPEDGLDHRFDPAPAGRRSGQCRDRQPDRRPSGATALLRHNLLVYGLGGMVVPFVGIKAIDMFLVAMHLA